MNYTHQGGQGYCPTEPAGQGKGCRRRSMSASTVPGNHCQWWSPVGDATTPVVLRKVVDDSRVPWASGGRPRTTSDAVLAARAFNNLKQWHGLAPRYDKLAVVYRAAAVLSSVIAWLAPLGDTS